MANRHLARSIVMQTLFQWDFMELSEAQAAEALTGNIEEFASGSEDTDFMSDILVGVIRKKNVIDNIIEKAAPDWPIKKINGIDRNIIRIGLYELLFGDRENVPPKVAINEAIEIAKAYSGDSSGRFVNGVLGAIYKEMGEPGKEQRGNKKKNGEIDISKLPIDEKGGAVVYGQEGGRIYVAMVHDVFGYWTLSKGSVEEGEDAEDAVVREVLEGVGLPVVIKQKLGQTDYIANNPKRGKVLKKVTYFLAESPFMKIELKDSGGLDDAKWFSLSEITSLRMYDDITSLLTKSIEILTK